MQLSAQTVAKYEAEAPELLDAVTSGEAEHIMKRDPETDYCVKFDKGWCGVHAKYGEDFLGDACHFFPRVTRKLGDAHLMTGSLSCPEMVRLGLTHGFDLVDGDTDRLPHSLKDYRHEALEQDKALQVHRFFLQAVIADDISPERAMAKLRSVAASMQAVDVASWGMAAEFYWKNADARLPTAEGNAADPFNLLNALQGLVGASKKTKRPRLDQTLSEMSLALETKLDWETLGITTGAGSLAAFEQMQNQWHTQWSAHFAPMLKSWLQAQLSVACFPYAGLGDTLTDRATLLGVRFATLKLALMSACAVQETIISEDDTVRVIQSLARFLDHLADPTLSLQIYSETGWVREARLRSVIGDY